MAHCYMESLKDSAEAGEIRFGNLPKGNGPCPESADAAAEFAAVQARGKPRAEGGLPDSLAFQFADFRCWIAVFLSR